MALLSIIQTHHPTPPSSANPQRTSGDTDYVADTDRLQQSEIGEFIGRAAADTENDCDVIHSVRSALGHPFFVGAHKTVSLC